VIIAFSITTCDDNTGGDTAVTFISVTANGHTAQTTTQLTLTFDKSINGLTADNITLSGMSGVSKGTLSGSNPYALTISGFTSGGTLSVAVAKSGYTISGSPKTVPIPVTLNSITANGSSTQTTTELTFIFSEPISDLTFADITLSGISDVSKGVLSGSNPYTLPIFGFTSSGTLDVAVTKSGYEISGSPKTADIYYSPPIPVTLKITANGSLSQKTTQLTLTFDKAISGLSADDIIFSGIQNINKGAFSGSNPYYLSISGFTSSAILKVAVAKPGYDISGSSKTVIIYSGNGNGFIEMIQIPGGSFEMGSNYIYSYYDLNTGNFVNVNNEGPVHNVTLSSFYMGKYEVTLEQWVAVMSSNPSSFLGGKLPVNSVSWYNAIVFCNKLSIIERLTPAYHINGNTDPSAWGSVPYSSNSTWDAVQIVSGSTGYRLPTEAQWEYAAKGGNGSPGNYTYSGSNNIDDVAWYDDIAHDVGKKAPNGLGLYDMSGNVWEWCWDWADSYSSSAQTDPWGASSGSRRVIRGGGWNHSAWYARSASRDSPTDGGSSLGFRLVRP